MISLLVKLEIALHEFGEYSAEYTTQLMQRKKFEVSRHSLLISFFVEKN